VRGAGVIDGETTISTTVRGRTTSVEEDESAAVIKLGAGVDAYVNENWAVNFEAGVYWPTSDLSDFTYVLLTLGAIYRF
jgi:opacity protein-like surface antigen